MAIGTDVKGLAKKFAEGKLHNAEGSRLEHNLESDAGLATNNHRRQAFQFLGFSAKVIVDRNQDEAASLALVRQLQQEEEAETVLRQAQEEASLRLALELSRRP